MSVTPVSVDRDSRTFRQAASLARAGFESIVVEGRPSQLSAPPPFTLVSPPEEQRTGEKPVESGLRARLRGLRQTRNPLIAALLFAGFRLQHFRRHVSALGARLPDAELYILHEFSGFPAVIGAVQRNGAKLIYDAHDFYSRILPADRLGAFDRNWLLPWQIELERRCVAAADAVLTVSEGLARDFAAEFGKTPVILRHCHDARLDKTECRPIRERLGIPASKKVIVSVGQAKEGIASATILAALKLLPEDVDWLVLGHGHKNLLENARKEGLQDRVHVPGPVGPNEVVPSLAGCDLGLLPYRRVSQNYEYALPNGLFQLLAARLPLLYGALPEITALCQAKGVGLAADLDRPAALAAAVLSLLDNPDLAGNARDRDLAAQALSWETEERKLLCLLETILAGIGDSSRSQFKIGAN